MKKKLLFVILGVISIINCANAQCNIVSGTSGVVHDSGNTISINYTCAVTGSAVIANLGWFDACGIMFPGIMAPWSNNTNSLGTATYTFSTPITSINLVIGYVGVNTQTQPESFTITTNGSSPALTVDAGTCAAWTILGNEITSPSVPDGMNAFVNILSIVPFTTLSIQSGANSSVTGGSSYGLCDASVVTSSHFPEVNSSKLSYFPNPGNGRLKLELNKISSQQLQLEIYNSLGAKILEQIISDSQTTTELDLTNFSKGIYFAKLYDDKIIYTNKIVIE